ncbi:unnamed protein product [Leptidea sinapis]|uniref:Uncharacterized protein n=1 Tax=Leptidea sinapis TaxID=189913 RepID=A0A5E4R3E2_9NEOP|nr:unnamed protein product [Leptidea sinapis]
MHNRNYKISSGLIFNHINRNIVHPSALTTLKEETSNVEIVEINSSSDESDARPDTNKRSTFSHAWSYVDHDRFNNGDNLIHQINDSARAKRRLNVSSGDNEIYRHPTNEDGQRQEDIYPSFYTMERNYPRDRQSDYNRQINRFTILNSSLPSDSSSEEQAAEEVIHYGDTGPPCSYDWYDDQDILGDEIFFSHDAVNDKRTIWIYSYKNKRILSENDNIFTNIPSKDSSTSSNDESEYEFSEEKPKFRKIVTPIIQHIPRLNLSLSPTLPTVTEVTEPIKQAESSIITNNAGKLEPTDRLSSTENLSERNKFQLHWNDLSPRIKNIKMLFIRDKESEKGHVYCEPEIKIMTNDATVEDTEIKTSENAVSSLDEIENCIQSSRVTLTKSHIKLTPPPITRDTSITDPIDKLEDNWIAEEKTEEKIIVYESEIQHEEVLENHCKMQENKPNEKPAHQFFINNIPLLKPAEWTQYFPITESVPSSELTICTNETNKQSWYEKLCKCLNCFNCAK